MIKSRIKNTPLNISNELEYKCDICDDRGIIKLNNEVINIDNNGNIIEDINEKYICVNGHHLKN